MNVEGLLARAAADVEVSRFLLDAGHGLQAVSRAYYAAFYAAEAALLTVGETRAKHSGVLAAFASRIVRGEGLDSAHAATLRELFRLRGEADDERDFIDAGIAAGAVADAHAFVTAVTEWVKAR